MTAVPPDRASYRWLTITLLVAAGVYAWYALSQYYRLNDLNQRQLSNAAAELKTALDNAAETVRQFNEKWNTFDQTKKEIVGPRTEERPRVCDFVRSQPYLELQHCATSGPSDDTPWRKYEDVQWSVEPSLGIEVTGNETAERFRYRTDRLLQELAFPDSFELIFVATDKGDVLYQDAPTRRRWLRHLRWGERTFRDAYADRPPTLQIHNVQQIVGDEAAWNKLRSVSSRTTVELGGIEHQLYLQPLVLDGPQSINLIMGGAVPRTSVFRDALALGTPVLGILVFLVLVGVLGFPFVKLTCLDMCERFCLWDIKRLYISSGALLVLFTCAALAADGYVRWRLEADRGLEPLAAHLESRFLDEVSAIREDLVGYDREIARKVANYEVPPCDQWGVDTNWYEWEVPGQLPWARDAHLKTVAWIEPGGQQIWKSTADTVPGKLRVGHRVYFRAVRDGNLFQIDGEGRPIFIAPDRSIADGKFYTFVSMKSTIPATLCADQEDRRAPVGTPVVATTAQLLSLDRQPLPAGYGFALVNREGRVLYHSDGRLSLRENLYEELSEGARARALTYAGRSGGLDTRYRERPHRFYLYPVRLSRALDTERDIHPEDEQSPKTDAGFYLATFRDTSVEQALVGHVFVAGLFGPMGLLLVLTALGLGILSLAARPNKHCWSVWLWPHGGLTNVYWRQALAFLLLLIVSVIVCIAYDTVTPFLLMPGLAVALGIGIYWFWAPKTIERSSLSTPTWQTLSVFLALVCMVVAPSAALFRLMLNHEFAKLILTERAWIAAQAEDSFRAASVEALNERYALARTAELEAARGKYLSCVPAPFVAPSPKYGTAAPATRQAAVMPAAFQTVTAEPRTPANCGVETDSLAPSTASAMLRPIGMVTGVVQLLHEVDSLIPIENEILTRLLFQDHGQSYSPDGTLIRWFRASGTALIGFALLFALVCWWIRWNTNHLFFADLGASSPPQSKSCEEMWTNCSPDEQMVLVQIAREHVANPYQRPIVEGLLEKGLVTMDPEIQPFSDAFGTFLRAKERELDAQIKKWQQADGLRSWRYGRLILTSSLAAIAFFLIATQPGLQSSVVAIATGMTGVLTAGSKLQEAIASWFSRKGGSS